MVAFLEQKDRAVHLSANRGDIEDPNLHMVLAIPAEALRTFVTPQLVPPPCAAKSLPPGQKNIINKKFDLQCELKKARQVATPGNRDNIMDKLLEKVQIELAELEKVQIGEDGVARMPK